MKITEELLNEMKIKDENFSDGLIKPDGDYVRIPRGHLHGMMELLPWTENEIWKMIPDDDSPLFWLIEKTGCVLTDYNNSIGMKMTPAQQTVFDMMRKHGVLTDDYYDLTKQREKVREAFSVSGRRTDSCRVGFLPVLSGNGAFHAAQYLCVPQHPDQWHLSG